jgi:hypothetical protein
MEEGAMKRYSVPIVSIVTLVALLLIAASPQQQTDYPNPPDKVVKLIFIHHSTGENWLTDGYGDLGRTLGRNNYFVSDANYGWGANAIGDRTDIPNWMEWFRSNDTPTYMDALFNESGQNSYYTRSLSDPGGENRVVMFKSCFPNNVAVFDFYNVLTDPDSHHRFDNGGIEHIVGGSNTLYYPSGNDHPSEAGGRKATEEFVPLLNIFYHRWQADAPLLAEPEPTSPVEVSPSPSCISRSPWLRV